MKTIQFLCALMMVWMSGAAFAEPSLDSQLQDLRLPQDQAPVGVTREKLYSSQSRFSDLSHRFELDFGGAKNLNANSSLSMSQLDGTVRFHLSNRWDLAMSGSYGFNSFTDTAQRLMQSEGILPDAAIVKWRTDLLVGYNLFYGKFRASMDQVFYFDQYIAIGPGLVQTQYQMATAGVADVGFAFWFGRHWAARMGAKSDIYNEQKAKSSDLAYHLLGHLDIGYVIGNGEKTYE